MRNLLQRALKLFRESWDALEESSLYTAYWVDGYTEFEIVDELRRK